MLSLSLICCKAVKNNADDFLGNDGIHDTLPYSPYSLVSQYIQNEVECGLEDSRICKAKQREVKDMIEEGYRSIDFISGTLQNVQNSVHNTTLTTSNIEPTGKSTNT